MFGAYTPLKTESALFSREFSVKQCRNSSLNYRNTPLGWMKAPLSGMQYIVVIIRRTGP
jgi:hypothetical protein